ncbi:MAG TPA: nitroreductase family deazaflavin-dependent oxidoreductase [Ktedonobacterales bacterium]|nr:nitroreductase family deazaflavin-dependent oxidoreductase [Ktedonobacterales bacterium]
MDKTIRIPAFVRMGNTVVTLLTRAGVPLRVITLLTVRGRKSGQPRTTPVAIIEQDGKRYLVAAYGVVDWVRNLRAAGVGTLTRGRRTEEITAIEVSPAEAAPILKRGLATRPAFLRQYFDTTPTSSLDEYAREAVRHPVFQIVATTGADRGK